MAKDEKNNTVTDWYHKNFPDGSWADYNRSSDGTVVTETLVWGDGKGSAQVITTTSSEKEFAKGSMTNTTLLDAFNRANSGSTVVWDVEGGRVQGQTTVKDHPAYGEDHPAWGDDDSTGSSGSSGSAGTSDNSGGADASGNSGSSGGDEDDDNKNDSTGTDSNTGNGEGGDESKPVNDKDGDTGRRPSNMTWGEIVDALQDYADSITNPGRNDEDKKVHVTLTAEEIAEELRKKAGTIINYGPDGQPIERRTISMEDLMRIIRIKIGSRFSTVGRLGTSKLGRVTRISGVKVEISLESDINEGIACAMAHIDRSKLQEAQTQTSRPIRRPGSISRPGATVSGLDRENIATIKEALKEGVIKPGIGVVRKK